MPESRGKITISDVLKLLLLCAGAAEAGDGVRDTDRSREAAWAAADDVREAGRSDSPGRDDGSTQGQDHTRR